MKILRLFFVLLFVAVHGAAGFSRPPKGYMQCGYRGTFCILGKCPQGNDYLGLCRPGYSCCKW
ncbi:GLL4 protein, partial [Penelope pileata]|nr:GLL4 protein [Penelope pileata]